MTIREYRDEDFEAVRNLIYLSFGLEREKVSNPIVHEFVGTIDDKVVGYFSLSDFFDVVCNLKIYHVDYVCIDENYRGHGLGKKMMDFIEKYSRERGINRLDLTSNPARIAANKLYQSCDYKIYETNLYRKDLV